MPGTRTVAAIAGLVALAAGAWAVFGPTGSPEPAPPLVPHPMAVARGVYLLGELDPGAAYAVDTTDGIALIDTGMEADARRVLAQMAALSLDVARVKLILLTHEHVDHIRGANALRKTSGARVYAGAADAGVIRAAAPPEALFSVFRFPGVTVAPTAVDVELKGAETLPLGEVSFRAIATPGHTPGSICYLMERGRERFLFAGDTIMTLADGQGTYVAYHAPRFRGDARAYLASLRALRALPAPDYVLPGHPRQEPEPQTPQLARARWEELLDRDAAEMEKLIARFQADGESFLDGTPRHLAAGLEYLGDHRGRAVYLVETKPGPLVFDAPGDAGFAAWLDERLHAGGRSLKAVRAVVLTSHAAEAIGGLHAVLEKSGCRVVAPRAAFHVLSAAVPADRLVDAATFWPGAGLEGAQVIEVPGRGGDPVVYVFRAGARTAALSGDAVPEVTNASALDVTDALSREAGFEGRGFLRALRKLEPLNPAIWLSAHPDLGRNANLYDAEWAAAVKSCEQLVQGRLLAVRPPSPRD